VFCAIVKGEKSSHKVFESVDHLAFLDIRPFVVGHTLVIPKKHYDTLEDMQVEEVGWLFKTVATIAPKIVRAVNAHGFRLIQNNGEAAAQVVKHVHVHILPLRNEQRNVFLKRLDLTDLELENIAQKIRESIS
jgi:histidine triad (HIT) family protein